jgi:hypothetical protein
MDGAYRELEASHAAEASRSKEADDQAGINHLEEPCLEEVINLRTEE